MTFVDPTRPSPIERRNPSLIPLIAFVVGVLAIGGTIGSLNIPDQWYRDLAKPAFNPPDWVFGPVWSVLYAMVGYAGYRTWRFFGAASLPFGLWAVQMLLNFAWTPIFFSLHSLPLASIEIAVFLTAVIAYMAVIRNRDRTSFWLFAPYLAWVGFATVLTWTIWFMNT